MPLPLMTPPDLMLSPPWPGEARETWWRMGIAVLLLLPAALLYAVVEGLARAAAILLRSD
jgi:hypothetical protein